MINLSIFHWEAYIHSHAKINVRDFFRSLSKKDSFLMMEKLFLSTFLQCHQCTSSSSSSYFVWILMTLLINLIYIRGTARDWKVFFFFMYAWSIDKLLRKKVKLSSSYRLLSFPMAFTIVIFYKILFYGKCYDMLLVVRFLVMNAVSNVVAQLLETQLKFQIKMLQRTFQ